MRFFHSDEDAEVHLQCRHAGKSYLESLLWGKRGAAPASQHKEAMATQSVF